MLFPLMPVNLNTLHIYGTLCFQHCCVARETQSTMLLLRPGAPSNNTAHGCARKMQSCYLHMAEWRALSRCQEAQKVAYKEALNRLDAPAMTQFFLMKCKHLPCMLAGQAQVH